MDQSKWALPRHRLISTAKECQKYNRPRSKIHAVWVHGVALNLFVVDGGVSSDASLILEALSLSLEGMVSQFEAASKPIPSQCLVWVAQQHSIAMVLRYHWTFVDLVPIGIIWSIPKLRLTILCEKIKIIAVWSGSAYYFFEKRWEWLAFALAELDIPMAPWVSRIEFYKQHHDPCHELFFSIHSIHSIHCVRYTRI